MNLGSYCTYFKGISANIFLIKIEVIEFSSCSERNGVMGSFDTPHLRHFNLLFQFVLWYFNFINDK